MIISALIMTRHLFYAMNFSLIRECVGREGLKNGFRLKRHTFLQKKHLFEFLTYVGIRHQWYDEFMDFWRTLLHGRPLTLADFHNLRFHYRLKFQETSTLDWSSTQQHMTNWQQHKNLYLLFGAVYAHALNPYRDCSFLARPHMRRVLEYGCSHAPYYRAWKKYFNHYDVQWTLADIKNISFLFSRYSYRNDASVEKFIIIDAKNADDPFEHAEEPFDAIILTTVLEHVHNPVTVIRSLTQHLRSGGVLVFDYIKSDAHGLDSLQGLSMREIALEYIREHYIIDSGDMSDITRSIGLCVGIKL